MRVDGAKAAHGSGVTAQEASAFSESIDRVCQAVARSLSHPPAHESDDTDRSRNRVPHPIAFVANLHRSVDQVVATAARAGPAPVCQPGCAHCCRLRVEATTPEVFHLARHVQHWPANDLAALLERLRHTVAARQEGGPNAHTDCALLVNQRCSAYGARPAACRKAHSLSVVQCETLAPQVPQNLALLLDAEALMVGTAAGYENAQLHAQAHELNAALLLALTHPRLEQAWLAGERVL